MRVPETGGEARAATRIEAGQTAHRFPQFLPDNRHFLYYVVGNEDQQGLYLASLDGVGTRIADADSAAAVLSNDRIIFNTQGVIAVHQLDLTRGILVGQPQTVIESAPINPYLASGALSRRQTEPLRIDRGPISASCDGSTAPALRWKTWESPAVMAFGVPDCRRTARDSRSIASCWVIETCTSVTSQRSDDTLYDRPLAGWLPGVVAGWKPDRIPVRSQRVVRHLCEVVRGNRTREGAVESAGQPVAARLVA